MTISFPQFGNGDTNYVARLNGNFATIGSLLDGINAILAGSTGGGSSSSAAFFALFGQTVSVIGAASYGCTGSSATLTVAAGFAWKPTLGKVVQALTSNTLDFTGQSAATYYVEVDATGAPSRSATNSGEALYSVVWTGSAFGTITLLAAVAWGAANDMAAQVSTALGATYLSLDDRLEASETMAVAGDLARIWQTGRLSLSVAGSTDVVLTALQANNAVMNFTGALTGNINVIVPLGTNPREWIVTNNTTGAYSLTVKGATGTGISVSQGGFSNLYQDGTNVLAVSGSGAGFGTVTSVGVSVPAFLSATGAITTAGTIDITFSGTAIPILNGGTGSTTASGARTALGLGTSATLDVDTDAAMAANSDSRVPSQKAVASYIASFLSNFDTKPECAYASTSALPANTYSNGTSGVGATLTGNVNGPLLIDGVTLAAGAVGLRILVGAEATDSHNGWFTLTQLGVVAVSPYILTRDPLSDQAAEIAAGYLTAVKAPSGLTGGSANDGKLFVSVAPTPFTVGSSSLTFAAIGVANTYTADETTLHLSGSQFSIKSGGVGTTELAAQAVTYAKIQNVSATSRLLGRKTAGAGSAEELTLSDVLDLVGSAAQGDIFYRGASTWTRLAAGTAGQMLKTQGASANPHWVDHEFLPVVSLSALTTASQILAKFTAPFAMTLAANMAGSKSTAADIAATASTVITVSKNGSAIATATYAVSGTVPTLATTGGTAQSIAADDVISITGPASPDATLSGIYLVALFARG